jgi:metallo-beta-lactamase class B
MRRILVLLALALIAYGQPKIDRSDWTKPFPPHRIVGPVYYVGTADLACFLITSPKGHILINTGLVDSTAQIRKNIETVGFKTADIKILLTNQAHFDHVAAMAEVKKQTGARMMATEPDKAVLEDGGASDFFLGKDFLFAPIKVDEVLQDGQVIAMGDVSLNTHLTPGHTRGSVTYSMRVREGGRDYNVIFANIPTVIGAQLVGNPKYPSIAADYARSFRVQKALACDIFLAGHGSQYRLREKYKPSYDPSAFVDPEGYKRAIAEAEAKFTEQLTREQRKLR